MKNTNIIASAFLALTLLLATVSFALAESSDDDSLSDVFTDANADGSILAEDISSSDIAETEMAIDESGKDFTKRTITRGSGWIVTNGKGGLLEIQFLTGHGSDQTVSKGWIKAGDLKFRIESTSSTDTEKKFTIAAKDGSVKGTLNLKRANSYQTGFGVWNGQIDLTVGSESFKADVQMALEEKAVGKGKIAERMKSGYSGGMELGGVYYDLAGKINSDGKLDLSVTGENKVVGRITLKNVGNNLYEGDIKLEEKGDEDDFLEGKISATLNREGNTLYGNIKVLVEEGSAGAGTTSEGTIKLAISEDKMSSGDGTTTDKVRGRSEDKSLDEERRRDAEKKEDSNSGSSDAELVEKGFFKRFFDFFKKSE